MSGCRILMVNIVKACGFSFHQARKNYSLNERIRKDERYVISNKRIVDSSLISSARSSTDDHFSLLGYSVEWLHG